MITNQQENLATLAKKKLKAPIIEPEKIDRLVFQRILGHLEQPLSQNWIQSDSRDCKVSMKLSYCVFIWNKRLTEFYSKTPNKFCKFRTFDLEKII